MRALALFASVSIALAGAEVRIVPSPAVANATAPSISKLTDGTPLLSWIEPVSENRSALKWSRFDRDERAWSPAATIAQGDNWFVNWADMPTVTALSDDVWLAVWFVNNPPAPHAHGHHGAGYHAVYSMSDDAGKSWSRAQSTTAESSSTEFTAVLGLGDNARALVAWLDGRKRAHGADEQALYAQTLLATGPDQLVDPRVCDCCQLSLVRTGNGALLAYRDRSAEEIRDIALARWDGQTWTRPVIVHDDGWKIAACPVNGPRLAARGAKTAVAWFTAAQEKPRVQVKFSPDAGATWGDPLRLDCGNPAGRLDLLMLEDGSALVSWLERGEADRAGVYVRRVSADGQLAEPVPVIRSTANRASGFPRMVEAGGGQVLMAVMIDATPARVETLLLNLN